MTVFRTQVAALVRRPSRIVLTGLALIVVSFVVFGTLLAQQITAKTVEATFSGTPTAVDLVVGSGSHPLPEGAATAIRSVPGVAEVAARYSDFGSLVGRSYIDDIEIISDPGSGPLSTVEIVRGSFPTAAGQIAISQRTLDRNQLSVGSTITVEVTEYPPEPKPGEDPAPGTTRKVQLRVTGVVHPALDDGRTAYATEAGVASLTASRNGVDKIDVRLSPGASEAAVQAAITNAVRGVDGGKPEIRTGANVRDAEMREQVSRVNQVFALMLMFVAISVGAALLVATSTFRIVFAQRMRQLALLRAVGAGRAQLTWALVVEGLLTGAVAGTIGVLAAQLCGQTVPRVASAFDMEISTPGVLLPQAVGVVVGAALLALIAVAAPAVAASRVSPLEALRASSVTAGRRDIGRFRAAAGLLLAVGAALVAGVVVASRPAAGEQESPDVALLAIVLSGTLAYFALVALGPVVLRPVLAVVGWPVRRLGVLGRLATGGIGAAVRRAAAVSVVVALGVTLMAGVLISGASLKIEVERQLAGQMPADFALVGVRGDEKLPAGTLERVRQRSEVTNVVPYRTVAVPAGQEQEATVIDVNLRNLSTWSQFGAISGSLERIGPGRAAVDADLASWQGLQVGQTIALGGGKHRADLKIVAVIAKAPLECDLVVDPADLDRLGASSAVSGVLADAAGKDEDGRTAGFNALRSVIGQDRNSAVFAFADERDAAYDNLNSVMGVALGLIGLTVLVAVVGVGATTALSVVERTREAGLLRAVGMTKAGLRGMLTIESGLYGAIGAVLGLALALPYAWLVIGSLSAEYPVVFPVWQLVGVMATLTLLTALAGVVPARKAARVSPVVALGADE